MDFCFTDDQQDLIDAAKAVFDGENSVERMRAMAAGEEVSGLWPQFAELGLLGFMAPESEGGLGQSLVVMAAVAEAAGYAGLPEPLIEVAGISVPGMVQATITAPELTDVIKGQSIVAAQSDIRPNVFSSPEVDYYLCSDDFTSNRDSQIERIKSIDPCLLYTSPSPRDQRGSRMPSSA